jgi:hypothetical protein
MLTNDDIVTYIRENYPNVGATKVAIDDVKPPFNNLAIRLFLDGYSIIASSPNENDLNTLNRIIHNMSGSMFRYRYAPFSNIYKEPATVLVATRELTEYEQTTKTVTNVISVNSSKCATEVSEPESKKESAPAKRGRKKSISD